MAGKNINYYLMDGEPSGCIKCTLSNWIGVAYKIPRTELERCKGRDHLSQSGVYFLYGASEETGDNVVYVGQAGVRKNGEGILNRLQEHKRNPDKDYWTEAVAFTTTDNSFGTTEISWLENCFRNLAISAERYIVKNGNEPNIGNVTEEKESELEEFVNFAVIVMGVLGYKVFEPLAKPQCKHSDKEPVSSETERLLHLKRKSKKSGITVEADCKQTTEGFVVLKGSRIETIDSDSIPPGIKEARQKAKFDENGILLEDTLFRSPSYAASFVIGGHANGLTAWVTIEGKTLKELEEE